MTSISDGVAEDRRSLSSYPTLARRTIASRVNLQSTPCCVDGTRETFNQKGLVRDALNLQIDQEISVGTGNFALNSSCVKRSPLVKNFVSSLFRHSSDISFRGWRL